MLLRDLLTCLEELAPTALQEEYDNCGLITGSPDWPVDKALITVDVTMEVLDEAIRHKAGLIISHHPPVFSALKRLTGRDLSEQIVIKAIQNNLALYAIHTNLDNSAVGVNRILCDKVGLVNPSILEPLKNKLMKLVFFVPPSYADQVCNAVFKAGAGHIGEYDSCSYRSDGNGTFRAGDKANPFVGEKNKLHIENEQRIEVILPSFLQQRIEQALKSAHPYEEPAYDFYSLANHWETAGTGMIGDLPEQMNENQFVEHIKRVIGIPFIRHSAFLGRMIKRVAVCGGSGSFLLKQALAKGADAFITADIRYHQFFDAGNRLLLIDAGHYETEQWVKELIYNFIIKKFPNFALQLSEINTNPINYY